CVYGNRDGDEICGVGTDNFSLDPLLCDPEIGNFHIEDASPCAPGNHPNGPDACGGALIGAQGAGCDSDVPEVTPRAVARLLGNRPNPFTGSTVISFALESRQPVSLDVLDASGRRVALLYQGVPSPGVQQVTWDGTTLGGARAESGVYFYRLRCGELTEGLRMLRLR
ncbi:MAG: T9SS type A sorting domain-containing protein, partial [Candidatus Eisenbacteria bacterium]|nr:T9SS type A sorting domain-containing protein [Candidatus Eisenbacteria bacterium]